MHTLFTLESLFGKADLYELSDLNGNTPKDHQERELILTYVSGFFQARCNADALVIGEILSFRKDPTVEMKKVYFSLILTLSGRTDDYTFPSNLKESTYVEFSDKKKEKVYKSSFLQNGTTFRLLLEFRHYFLEPAKGVGEDDLLIVTYIFFDNTQHYFKPNGAWTWSYNLSWSDNATPRSIDQDSLSDTESFENISVDLDDD